LDLAKLTTRTLAWIAPDASIGEAAHRLAVAPPGAGCLLVGRPGEPPLGVISAVDVLRAAASTALAPGRLEAPCGERERIGPEDLACEGLFGAMARGSRRMAVRDIMSSPVLGVNERASVPQVLDLMIRHGIECVPVFRERCVVGMVPRRAVLIALAGEMSGE
jgi:CBS domain-containing protein